ncbi:MAG: hypothetical protein ACPGYT_09110 [Nitrospirales bacterium]
MTHTSGLFEFLSRDTTFLGGPQSPLLSWLGSLGILLFFIWHIMKLRKEVTFVRSSFEGIRPRLLALIKERGDIDRERFSQKNPTSQTNPINNPNMRIDSDDLHALDAEMGKAPLFRDLWSQYRMTLLLEQVPWFMEPRIFSTKRAEEVFTQEALMANRVNFPFYSQFPSLVTSIGLLLTFVALFIGLGKLHAEGTEILGVQGLINGLAGKFLTSIVGLVAANVFTFIEKPIVSQLMNDHHIFLRHIDQLFPRKTMEQILEQLTWVRGENQSERAPTTRGEPGGGQGMNGLAGSMTNLTSAIQSFTRLQEEQHEEIRQTIADLPRMISKELQSPIHELMETVHDLSNVLQEVPTEHVPREQTFEQRPLLWKNASDVMDPFATIHPRKTKSWLRWPSLTREKQSG